MVWPPSRSSWPPDPMTPTRAHGHAGIRRAGWRPEPGVGVLGIVLDGLDGDPATFDGLELARNHTLHASCDWEAGGMRWDTSFTRNSIQSAPCE
jgi:hypothetical protein